MVQRDCHLTNKMQLKYSYRSIDAEGLKALETKYSPDVTAAEAIDASTAQTDNHLESALAQAEFGGARDDAQVGVCRNGSVDVSGSGGIYSNTIGRVYLWRRRDGCMWMRIKRRRRHEQNRFLDTLVRIQV